MLLTSLLCSLVSTRAHPPTADRAYSMRQGPQWYTQPNSSHIQRHERGSGTMGELIVWRNTWWAPVPSMEPSPVRPCDLSDIAADTAASALNPGMLMIPSPLAWQGLTAPRLIHPRLRGRRSSHQHSGSSSLPDQWQHRRTQAIWQRATSCRHRRRASGGRSTQSEGSRHGSVQSPRHSSSQIRSG